MQPERFKNLKTVIHLLENIQGFDEFFKHYVSGNEVDSIERIVRLLESFKDSLIKQARFGETEQLILAHTHELLETVSYATSNYKIFQVSATLKPKEEFVFDFSAEFDSAKTSDVFFQTISPKRYKTKTEKIAYHGCDGKKVAEIYHRYKGYNHPYIHYLTSLPFIESRQYTFGIPILNNALKYAFRFPNHFWHSKIGVEACGWSLFRLQNLLGYEGMLLVEQEVPLFKQKLLKLIYLYLSRYIYMTNGALKAIDCYTHRAQLIKDYHIDFAGIWGLQVNPDIQFISDYYLAHEISEKYSLSGIPQFKQLFWDSLKMYEHGSLIPNATGGYKDIEERTWVELVSDGASRSIRFSEKLLQEFEDHELNLTNTEVDFACQIALEIRPDDNERFNKQIPKPK